MCKCGYLIATAINTCARKSNPVTVTTHHLTPNPPSTLPGGGGDNRERVRRHTPTTFTYNPAWPNAPRTHDARYISEGTGRVAGG